MDNEYSTRSIFLESVAVDNFMKTRLDKMVVIRMESKKREKNQEKLKLGILNCFIRVYSVYRGDTTSLTSQHFKSHIYLSVVPQSNEISI